MMRYLSLFSGIEAASIAWEPLGWEPVAFCEIDEFPSAVLAHHWPHVPNLGDITEVDWSEFNERYGAVDVIVGGSPCQSFSVAGKREGLRGESGLMFEYIRAVREVRPRWFVWENVPGALSSEKGAAFGQLLTEMDDLGYGLAWRVLDAQFFGVAQRRRRVFLVGSLGSQHASEVLFEPDSLRWDHPSSREQRENLTRAVKQRASEGCGEGCLTPWDGQHARIYGQDGAWPTLGAASKVSSNSQAVLTFNTQLYENHGQDSRVIGPCEVAPTVSAKYGTGGGNTPLVLTAPTIVIDRAAFNQGVNAQYDPHIEATDVMDTLVARGPHAVCMASGQANAVLAFNTTCITSPTNGNKPQWGDPCHCLAAQDHPPTIVIDGNASAENGSLLSGYTVRRLTPRECERLQGFPDDHTLIPYRGKPAEECPDTPRYKALGNSFAVPVVAWIGRRIEEVEVGD